MSGDHVLITGLSQLHIGHFSRLVSPLQTEPNCSLSHPLHFVPAGDVSTPQLQFWGIIIIIYTSGIQVL